MLLFFVMQNFSDLKKSLEFLKNMFSKYYKSYDFVLPDRFARREFAFVFFGGKGMMRHIGYEKKNDFVNYLRTNTPCHVYYSSAYYKTPDASNMLNKKWMGAELIFDLDSDHLPNAENLSYEKQLELVKKEFFKLVNDFLISDFGFNEKYLELYFSGGRGYHCHVKDPKVLMLNSSDRREIVDYITGRDLKDSIVFYEKVTSKTQIKGKSFASGKTLKMPKPDEPGWKGRISRGIIDIVEEIKNSKYPIEKLKDYGVSEKDAEKLINELSEERINRIKQGNLDQSKTIRKFFLNNALRKTAVNMSAGETDEPVTCDVKRLIRLPGSLHGKTGFKVEKLEIDKIKEFNPLVDTIVFPEDIIKIKMNKDYKIEINNQDYRLSEGTVDVPEFLAVFLIARKLANII